MSPPWRSLLDRPGATPGPTTPHEALVDEISRLRAQVAALAEEQQRLRARLESLPAAAPSAPATLDDRALLEIRRQQAFVSPGLDLVTCRVDELVLSTPSEDIGHVATWLYEPAYDRGQRQLLRELLAPGMTFIDVGANVGMFTALAARQVGPTGRVIAYEPIPRLVEVIRTNLASNAPRTPSELKACCAYSRADTLRLQVYAQNNRVSTLAAYAADAWTAQPTQIEVPAVRLDDDLARLDRLDLLKIDAEGAECEVLEGASALLERFASALVLCEFEPEHLQRAGAGAAAFIALCRRFAFDVAVVDDGSGALHWIDDLDTLAQRRGNLLLSRRGRDLRRPLTIGTAQMHCVDSVLARGALRIDGPTIRYDAATGAGASAPTGSDVLFFGPYIPLAAGRHAIRLRGEIDGSVRLRLTAACGRVVLLETLASHWGDPFVINLGAPVEDFEVVASTTPGLRRLMLTSIVIEPLA